jgi:hypothetical protein
MIWRSTFLLGITSVLLLAGLPLTGGEKKPSADIQVDKEKKTVTISCVMAPRKLPNLDKIYPLEVIATFPPDGNPKGQKAHETVVNFTAKPSEVHKALESLGLKAGKPALGKGQMAQGPEVKIFLEVPSEGGTKKVPIEKTMIDEKTGKPLPTLKWLFTGSAKKQPDPEKDDTVYGADLSGTLITIFPVTDDTVFQAYLKFEDQGNLTLETNPKVVPKIGTPVKLIIQVK